MASLFITDEDAGCNYILQHLHIITNNVGKGHNKTKKKLSQQQEDLMQKAEPRTRRAHLF